MERADRTIQQTKTGDCAARTIHTLVCSPSDSGEQTVDGALGAVRALTGGGGLTNAEKGKIYKRRVCVCVCLLFGVGGCWRHLHHSNP